MKSYIKGMLAAAVLAFSAHGAAAEATKVKVWGSSAVPDVFHGFLFLGGPLGFYEKEGVDVEFGAAGGSVVTLQLLASGQVDLGYVGMDVLILAKKAQPNLPVKAVYLHDQGNIYEIVVPEEGDLAEVKDLDGKLIGVVNHASGAIPNLKGMLTDAGLDPNTSVGLVPVGLGAQAAAALNSGRVDALALMRSQHSLIETLGNKFRYFTREAPSAVLAVNTDFLEKNRDAVIKTLRGIALSSTFAQVNPEAAVREFWKIYGMPKGLTEDEAMQRAKHVLVSSSKLWKDYKDPTVKWGQMDVSHWDRMQNFMVQQKLLPATIPSDDLFTAELIDEVNAVDLQVAIDMAEAAK